MENAIEFVFIFLVFAFIVATIIKTRNHFYYLKSNNPKISRYDTYMNFSMWDYNIFLKLSLMSPFISEIKGAGKSGERFLNDARMARKWQVGIFICGLLFVLTLMVL